MRKTIVHTLFYISAVVMLFASCAGKETYRIGVSQCAEGRWREKVNNEMLAAQHLYEQDVKVTLPTRLHQSRQPLSASGRKASP